MSLIQEFVEQNLSKNLNSSIIQQLQLCHSAIEQLLINLESLRSSPKLQVIELKIKRISIFLDAKQHILKLIQSDEEHLLLTWLIQQKIESSLIIQLIRKQQNYVQDQLKKIIKNVFLNGQKLQEYLQQNEMIGNCLELLRNISEQIINNKTPSRDKLISIDKIQNIIWQKVKIFEDKIIIFNKQIIKFIDHLYQFQKNIIQQFKIYFNQNQYHSIENQSNQIQIYTRNNQPYQQNIIKSQNKNYNSQFIKSQGKYSIFSQVRQQPLYQSTLQKRDSYPSKIKSKNQISHLGIKSRLNFNSSAQKDFDRNLHSQLAQSRPFLR